MVETQLVERSLPTPEISSLNPDISKILSTICTYKKMKRKKKRLGKTLLYQNNDAEVLCDWCWVLLWCVVLMKWSVEDRVMMTTLSRLSLQNARVNIFFNAIQSILYRQSILPNFSIWYQIMVSRHSLSIDTSKFRGQKFGINSVWNQISSDLVSTIYWYQIRP